MLIKTSFEDYKDIDAIINSISTALGEFGLTMVQDPGTVGTDGYAFIITDKDGGNIEQSIPDGTPCVFSTRGIEFEEFFDTIDTEIDGEKWDSLEGKQCIVVSLETFSELGGQDFEYYNIKFSDGTELSGISGYHLEVIN